MLSPRNHTLKISFAGFANLLMLMPSGFIADKIGRKASIVPGTLLSALAFGAFTFSHQFWQVALCSGLYGLANGLEGGSMSAFTYDITSERARARMQSLRRLAGEAGMSSGPLLGGIIADASGAGSVFLFYSPLLAIAAVLVLFLTKESLHAKRPVTR